MINLISSGATPIVAMMLAGHDNPEMSSHYYSNITTLIECQTYRQYKALIRGSHKYALSDQKAHLNVADYVKLDGHNRCSSKRVKEEDFSDCYKVSGPAGEIGFCPNCQFFVEDGNPFKNTKEYYKNKIQLECKNLEEIVKKVRKEEGEPEEIIKVLLKLRDEEYSYQQYLLEKMDKEKKNA